MGHALRAQGSGAGSPPLKAQLPADQRAYKAASDVADPAQRLAALRKFVTDYPDSGRVMRAQEQILDLLLKHSPERTAEIDAQARLIVKKSGKNIGRWDMEASIADALAQAGTSGLDLPLAEKLAGDANKHLTEPAYADQIYKMMKKYKEPKPSESDIHVHYVEIKEEALEALGDIAFDEGHEAAAEAVASEAYTLAPLNAEALTLRGRVALNKHEDAEALDALERAELAGELDSPWREKMMALYRAAHGGSDAGFAAEMDAKYAQLFPAPFTAPAARPITGGHTALVELFTGSACPPCVGADLALDELLKNYPRRELVALVFDQHIPAPDPLANPDSLARAAVYGVNSTPTFVVDGTKMVPRGGPRKDARELYDDLVKAIDGEAARGSGVQLNLSADHGASGDVEAHAEVTLAGSKELSEEIARRVLPEPPAPKAVTLVATKAATKAASAAPKPAAKPAIAPAVAIEPPHLVVNLALVEDDVRYSGENGIRFHRMVVRSLAREAGEGFPMDPGKTTTVKASFDPAAISAKWSKYLDSYQAGHSELGWGGFLSKDTSMQPSHLYVAAWVQDTTTHRVLGVAVVPVAGETASVR
jgi:thiol-disulfide isomerase/thioredoxin